MQRADVAGPGGDEHRSPPGVSAAQARDALLRLHDPGRLQTHPLAALVGDVDRAGRGKALQRALLEAVGALKPGRDGAPGPKAVRRYRLLKRRYVDGLSAEAVQAELRVGRSEYYREQERALEAVASLLAERLGPTPGTAPAPGAFPNGFPRARAPTAPPNNLPLQWTSFVGRAAELAEVGNLVGRSRLVTLTGTGGCGKTRLALRAAADLLGAYPDGVWLVDLAPLADPGLVAAAALAAVGAREEPGRSAQSVLVEHLRPKTVLLVLDNCEHLIDACARLAEALLRGCPDVRVLATSREMLRIQGEIAWRVPSLAAPAPGAPHTAGTLARYAAAELFVERARTAQPAFRLGDENAPAIAQLCHRLDGLPLAIELAAARVRLLAPREIAERLDDRFRLLTGGSRTSLPRQQTLRATVDWSYDLLGEGERALFRRLSVFAGGWPLDAAEAVGAGHPIERSEVLDLLAGLVDKSLVVSEESGAGTRYRFLETVRHYAAQKLVEADEAGRTRDRHLDHFLALAERGVPRVSGRGDAARTNTLSAETDNLRAAAAWSTEQADGQRALRLARAIAWWWGGQPNQTEAREIVGRAVALPTAGEHPRLLADALAAGGALASRQQDARAVVALYEDALARYRALRDDTGASFALAALGTSYNDVGRGDRARELTAEAVALARRVGEPVALAGALFHMADVVRDAGDLDAAAALYAESLALRRAQDDRRGIVWCLLWLGGIAAYRDDHAAARRRFDEALALSDGVDDWSTRNWALCNALQAAALAGDGARAAAIGAELMARARLDSPANRVQLVHHAARVAVARGQTERAARLHAAAVRHMAESGRLQNRFVGRLWERLLDRAAVPLDPDARRRAEEAWAEGRAMTLEDAVADALNDAAEEPTAPALATAATAVAAGTPHHPAGAAGVLSPREREVAALIARGYTNRRIAAALVVAETTAERHVANILAKLGAHARSEVAAWAATHLPAAHDG